MKSNATNLKGKRFGRLVAIKRTESFDRHAMWECLCDCGNISKVRSGSLTYGSINSCGCLNSERLIKLHTTHNMSRTKFYHVWDRIIQRCTNPNEPGFYLYGGRGILVNPNWLKFEGFRDDMYESYLKHVAEFGENNTSIDRVNPNGNYEPSNCRWATKKEQGETRRDSNKSENPQKHKVNRLNIMRSIRHCLLRGQKSSYVFDRYVGCSIEEFKRHIESQWLPEMTWNNLGRAKKGDHTWQLDHIVECYKFDLSKEEDLRKCFHYTNFQPMWWEEHLAKRRT